FSRSFNQISSEGGITAETLRSAVESKAYYRIPEILLDSSNLSSASPNPFSFLSSLSEAHQIQVIDEILQYFIPIRPRSRPVMAYSCLLYHTLENPSLLPLSLSVVQRTLRSGCVPPPRTQSLLSEAWIDCRRSNSVSGMLTGMLRFGYSPDSGTCNHLIFSLCKNDQLEEAANVVKGMQAAGCVPDSDSYGFIIDRMIDLKRSDEALRTADEMVRVHGLVPRNGTVLKAVRAAGGGDVSKRVELIELLEDAGGGVGVAFEAYESVLEGCVKARRWILAGKFALRMAGKGFIPYIGMRRMVVEGLVSV
ncbi:hypothetical protein M569_08615, partial [Genlisea aurea]